MAKQWTKKERMAAARAIIVKRHGIEYADGYWGKHEMQLILLPDCAEMLDLQCELTEAAEIIGDCVYSGDWEKLNAWLSRNRKEDAQ